MIKFYPILLIVFLSQTGFSQTTMPSTIGEIYNLAAGDSFEYVWNYGEGGAECYGSGYELILINSKSMALNSISYGYSFINPTPPLPELMGCNYNAYNFPPFFFPGIYDSMLVLCNWQYNSFDSIIINYVDSSIFNGFIDTSTCPIGETITCFDSVIIDANIYHGRKQNKHSHMDIRETLADGIGLVFQEISEEGQPTFGLQQSLIYYHKAAGETWGTPHSISVGIEDPNKTTFDVKIFPNPATSSLQLELFSPPSQPT